MKRLAALALILIAGVSSGCSGEPASQASEQATRPSSAIGPLDCGQGKDGSERAVRTFFAALRSGGESRILDALATGRRFEWVNVGRRDGSPVLPALRNKRRATATAIAEFGGLPIRATEFMNIDRPSRTMDFGFWGKWRNRQMVGKGAVDCEQGRARVLSAAVGIRR